MEEAREHCTRLALEHYENFPVGSRWIRADLRADMHAIYAFARGADDFADEAEHEGVRLERLAAWRSELQKEIREGSTHPVFMALGNTIRRHEIPVLWLEKLIEAFEHDCRVSRHDTFESIMKYAEASANPVGRLVLWLHGYREESLFHLSDAICSALQFANFWQDVAVDLEKDRIYLPQNDMRTFGYTEDDLLAGTVDERFRGLMRLEMGRTWDLFEKGRALCDLVGRDLQWELRLVWSGGTRILERLEAIDFDVFRRRPTLKKIDKLRMLWRATRWRRGPGRAR